VRIRHIRLIQIRLVQVRPNQNRIRQIRVSQIRLIQIRIRQIRPTEIRPAQIHVPEICGNQIQIAKIPLACGIPTQKLFSIHNSGDWAIPTSSMPALGDKQDFTWCKQLKLINKWPYHGITSNH
jgi:hypothetical protein